MLLGTEVSFVGHLTLHIKQERLRNHTQETLHALAKRILHDFPAAESYQVSIKAHGAAITFRVPGDADTEDEGARAAREYAKLIYSRYESEFSCYGVTTEFSPLF